MRVRVQKWGNSLEWGNSLALRIPKSFASETALGSGAEIGSHRRGRSGQARLIERVPDAVLGEVLQKLGTLLACP